MGRGRLRSLLVGILTLALLAGQVPSYLGRGTVAASGAFDPFASAARGIGSAPSSALALIRDVVSALSSQLAPAAAALTCVNDFNDVHTSIAGPTGAALTTDVEYAFTLNSGCGAADGPHLIARLPGGATLVSISGTTTLETGCGSMVVPPGSDPRVSCDFTFGTIPPKSSVVERIVVHLARAGTKVADADATTTNIELHCPTATPCTDTGANDNTSSLTTAVNPVVNTTADANDDLCDATNCTLREAILTSNANPDVTSITFSLTGAGSYTINLSSALPAITDAVTIDATTVADGGPPNVELVGTAAPGSGFDIEASNVTIRGFVINRFLGYGIYIGRGTGSHIEHNYIGTDVTGTTALGNGFDQFGRHAGVGVFSGGNVIGGALGSGNVISANGADGIYLYASANGTTILNNYIGTNAAGTAAVGNTDSGVWVNTPDDVSVEGNLLSGNGVFGVAVNGARNRVVANRIGTNASGTEALPNGTIATPNRTGGVFVEQASSTIVDQNLISGNIGAGVHLLNAATGTALRGNTIGLNRAGTAALANTGPGVRVEDSSGTTIGGSEAGIGATGAHDGNFISGNARNGIELIGAGATGNVIEGNFIGPDGTARAAIGNGAAEGYGVGVLLSNAANNVIGGTSAELRNVVAGNRHGIHVLGAGSTGNTIQGNFIGLTTAGPLGNTYAGIAVSGSNNAIGGTATAAGNTIANNSKGVVVLSRDGAGVGNAILSNSIYSNSGPGGSMGIDLEDDGPTANDPNDADTGANGLQNFPSFLAAISDTTTTHVAASFQGAPNTTFTVQFFASPACSSSGFGEGKTPLGTITVATNVEGRFGGSWSFPVATPLGNVLTVTVTDPQNNTSEFSACRPVEGADPVVNVADDANDGLCDAAHCSLREAIALVDFWAGIPQTIRFNIPGAGVHVISPTGALPPIGDPTTIDGTTQPGFVTTPVVVIDGALAGSNVDGLSVTSRGTTVRALGIRNFSARGVFVANATTGPGITTISQNEITGNLDGVQFFNVDQATIANNVVSGNTCHGMYLGSTHATSVGNNSVGVTASGVAAGNGCDGIILILDGGSVGSANNALVDNVVAHNASAGVRIVAGSNSNVLVRDSIHDNGADGVLVDGATTDRNQIEEGSITANAGLGISLANGANAGIAPPVITDILLGGSTITVSGTSGSGAFVSIYADPQDEGQTFLGATTANVDGAWTKSSGWTLTDLTTLATALKAGSLTLRATQRDSAGNTSRFSGTAAAVPSIVGVASCTASGTFDGPPPTVLLRGARVELYSGDSLVATTTSDASTAAYRFTDIAPAEYTVRYSLQGTICGTELSVSAEGASVGPTLAPLDYRNHVWTKALDLTLHQATDSGGAPVAGLHQTQVIPEHILKEGQSDWFKFPIDPDSRVVVVVTGLPANYDLTLYKDIAQAFTAITSPQDVARLDAEFTPDAFTPDAFTPDAFTPDAFTPDAFTPDAFTPDAFTPDAFTPDAFTPDAFTPDAFTPDAYTPDAFTPDAFTPDAFTPDAFTPDAFTPDAFTPDAFTPDAFTPDAFTSAQTRSLIGVSAHEGTAGEGIVKNTWLNDGNFYVRVRGRNGAFSLAAPFQLQVFVFAGQCANVPLPTGTTPTVANGAYSTVILTDLGRMEGTDAQKAALDTQLTSFAARPEVNGVIVRLGETQYSKVASANAIAADHPTCPYAKNLLAGAVKEIVDTYRQHDPIEYVVIVGGDSVIPFFRHPDQALLASETGYKPPVKDNTASRAALELGYVVSDDDYGAKTTLSIKDHTLPLVDVAVGRLVETADDASKQLDAYMLGTTNGVAPAPTSALVTGYDFFADMANEVSTRLSRDGGIVVTALIQPADKAPTDAATNWTADDLRAAWLSTRRDLFVGGMHGTAFSGLASDYETRVRPSDLTGATVDLRNTVNVFQSCHLGYNRVNADAVSGDPLDPDWAQAFARKGALLIASTGYQYGETELVEYGERLNVGIARQLRTGTGPIAVGKALVEAKRTYLADTPLLRAIHEKTVLEVALFGLPMLKLDLPGLRDSPPATNLITPTAVATKPGAVLGLSTYDVAVHPSLNTQTVTLKNTADGSLVATSYLTGAAGAVVNPAEPVLPREVLDASAANTTLRGVGLMGADYADESSVRPLTGAPATELRTPRVPFASDVLFPTRFWAVNYFDAVDRGRTRLIVMPSQFKGVEVGTRRSYSEVDLRLYYSNSTASICPAGKTCPPTQTQTPALASAPAIAHVAGVPGTSGIGFSVDVSGAAYAGMQAVWITYTGTSGSLYGHWRSVVLAPTPGQSTRWTGLLAASDLGTTPASDVRFIAQAVNGVGLVSMDTSLGAYYVPGPETVAPQQPKGETSVAFLTAPPSATYREKTTFSAVLTPHQAGETLTFKLGAERLQAITNDAGAASVTFSLFQTPGAYDVQISVSETETHLASSATARFTIQKRNTTLAITPSSGSVQYSDLFATLADDAILSRRLRDQTVFYVITGPGVTYTAADVTDYLGRVPLDLVPFAAGTYQVDAYFSGTIPGPIGITLTNDRYNASHAHATLTFAPEAATAAYTGDTIAAINTAFTARAAVTQDVDGRPGTITLAQVRFTVKDGSGSPVETTTVAVDPTGIATASLPGLPIGVYTIETSVVGAHFTSPVTQTLFASYDPSAGYVTGGGWITSPAGAYTGDATLTGRATFGFVSRYQKGASTPSGQTEFRFTAAGFTFKSTSYEWLVISGAKAQYKGSGTVNGVAGYKFLLTVTDGDVTGGGGQDKFRIKIWNAGGVVYDNVAGAGDALSAANPQAIGGGSIVIHQ